MAEFSENTRVKFPAILHLMKLGYKYEIKENHKIDLKTNIFLDLLKPSLEKINNRIISDDEFKDLIIEIQKITNFNDHGKSFYERLVHPLGKINLIDFDNISNNLFSVVTELPFGENGTFRPDIILLINGIPLAFLEVKKPNNIGGIKAELDRMNEERLPNESYRRYFNIMQVLCFSNNMPYLVVDSVDNSDSVEIKQGSFYGTANGNKMVFNYFREEQPEKISYLELKENDIDLVLSDNKQPLTLKDNDEFITNCDVNSPVNSFSNSVLSIPRLMFFLKFGIIYDGMDKHIMRYHQFFATNNVLSRVKSSVKKYEENLIDEGKALRRGIIWHTQGSGKTELAAFISLTLQDYFKKNGIIGRFFFIVDRLDLLIQASSEFSNRGFAITPIKNKVDFNKELKKLVSVTERKETNSEMSVVNIQRIMENDTPLETIENPYGAKVQRVIFVDEAHRSFKKTGTFYANLMTVDPNAIYIALTGTPIIDNKEKSTLKFGPYFHKYFYDKSIADGYTLKIKLEPIETQFKNIIKHNIEVEEGSLTSNDITTNENYVNSLAKYIDNDFKNFRLLNSDDTLGAMIVCKSSLQAEMLQSWFEKNSEFKTALVLDDTPNNKDKQESFKKTDKDPSYKGIDILIVFYMLTTGFDAHRLKKMYMLRQADKHGLLQTISRVNRTYTNPKTNYNYNYGYIVDFVNIEDNIEKTMEKYRNELNEDNNYLGDEGIDLSHILVDSNVIKIEYENAMSRLLSIINIDNLEVFSQRLSMFNKETVLEIKKIIEKIKNCYTEFRLSESREDYSKIDINKFNKLYKEVCNRIKFINLLEKPVETIKADYLSNSEIVVMIFEFIKHQSYVIDLSKLVEDDDSEVKKNINSVIEKIRNIKGSKDPRMVKLDEELKKVLSKLLMKEFDIDLFNSDIVKLDKEISAIEREHNEISKFFAEDSGYVNAYYEIISNFEDIDKEKLITFIIECKKNIDQVLETNQSMYRTRDIFIRTIKNNATERLDEVGVYDSINLMDNFDKLLLIIYNNITLIK